MLTVLFISSCEKKAFTRTRRILNAYSIRVGERSWETRITAEGLDTVRKELSRQASRNTSVVCRIVKQKKFEIAWVVGCADKFSDSGRFPARRTCSSSHFYTGLNPPGDPDTCS